MEDLTGSFKQKLNHLYYQVNLRSSYKRNEKIFTVSDFSKKDILKKLPKVERNKIEVIYESAKDFPEAKTIDNIPSDYFLAPCLRDPRKSTEEVVLGFLQYKKQGGDKSLVLFGDEGYLLDIKKERGSIEDDLYENIFCVGRVSDSELRYLYENASAFYFCSKYEGFGLPILEAMRFSCPVVTTNSSSLPEVAGDAAYFIDLCSSYNFIDEITKSMFMINKELSDLLIDKGHINLMRFSWSSTADNLLNSIIRR